MLWSVCCSSVQLSCVPVVVSTGVSESSLSHNEYTYTTHTTANERERPYAQAFTASFASFFASSSASAAASALYVKTIE